MLCLKQKNMTGNGIFMAPLWYSGLSVSVWFQGQAVGHTQWVSQAATPMSRSLWLVDPRAADIQAIEGMKSSIF